jgi:hypothetical protein
MTCGPVPARTLQASSAKVTSRTSCRPFSIVGCPRRRSASRAGLVCAWVRLVTASTVTVRQRRLRRSRILRVTWMTWAVCGNPNPPTETAFGVRSSTRPCARSPVRSRTGTCCQARRVQRSPRVGWLALTVNRSWAWLLVTRNPGGGGVGVQRVLCRGRCYAEVAGGAAAVGGDRAGEVGIITGFRGRR